MTPAPLPSWASATLINATFPVGALAKTWLWAGYTEAFNALPAPVDKETAENTTTAPRPFTAGSGDIECLRQPWKSNSSSPDSSSFDLGSASVDSVRNTSIVGHTIASTTWPPLTEPSG